MLTNIKEQQKVRFGFRNQEVEYEMRTELRKAAIDKQMIELDADTRAKVILEKAEYKKLSVESMVNNDLEKLW